jgi:rhamnosyltransferase
MATLPGLLDRIESAAMKIEVEIVAVDSGSVDGSVALLEARTNRLLRIAPEAFNHGTTRNLGIAETRAPFVVLIVQDALPVSANWLDRLVQPLHDRDQVAGAWARQEPREDADSIMRHYMRHGQTSSTVPRVSRIADESELAALPPMARLARCTFDNVCSCIRRTAWEAHPFKSMPIAEDVAWGRDVLRAGYELAYVPDVSVRHSHDRSAWYEYARTRTLHRQLAELFELETVPSLRHLGRAIASTTLLHGRLERWNPRRLPRALALAVAWPLGQYAGARDARRGGRFTAAGV